MEKDFEKFFEKNWIAILAFFCIFFAWGNVLTAIQTISIPFILAYLFLLLKKSMPKIRIALLVFLIVLLVFSNLIAMGFSNEIAQGSDIPIFIKTATNILVAGKNPYHESFNGTAMDEVAKNNWGFWKSQGETRYVPIDTFTYLPAIFLAAVPFYLMFPTLNFSFLALALLICVFAIELFFIKKAEQLELLLILTFFNPFIYFTTSWAHPVDSLILLLLLLFTISYSAKRFSIAGIFFGTLLATKAYVFLIAPFFFWFFLKEKKFKTMAFALIAFSIIVLPFALWNFQDFSSDALMFGIDSGEHSQLIWQSRAGMLPLLVKMQIIKNTDGWIGIPAIALILALILWHYLKKKPAVETAFLYSAIASIAALFFSKSMNDYYLSFPFYLILCILLAKALKREKNEIKETLTH